MYKTENRLMSKKMNKDIESNINWFDMGKKFSCYLDNVTLDILFDIFRLHLYKELEQSNAFKNIIGCETL